MACITHIRCRWMIARFPGRGNIIMATGTTTDDLCVIQWRNKLWPTAWRNIMTGFTKISSGWMVCRFSTRCRTVMATCTGSNNMAVIHRARRNGYPRCGRQCMTCFAGIGRINMIGAFTRCQYAIVTTGTDAYDLRVVYGGGRQRCPGGRLNRYDS